MPLTSTLPHPVIIADVGGTHCRMAEVPFPGAEPRNLLRIRTSDLPSP
jgi:glucokinase